MKVIGGDALAMYMKFISICAKRLWTSLVTGLYKKSFLMVHGQSKVIKGHDFKVIKDHDFKVIKGHDFKVIG
jgi:hypothetical protein